jgi:hypothetical protein
MLNLKYPRKDGGSERESASMVEVGNSSARGVSDVSASPRIFTF